MFCVSLDGNKAFDRILHSGLYAKLLHKGVNVNFMKLLQYWYCHLVCAVMWNSVVGDHFHILCGVRQGSVLSPLLFSIYINDVIDSLRHSNCGLLWTPAQRKRASMLYFANVFYLFFYGRLILLPWLTEVRESFTRGGP